VNHAINFIHDVETAATAAADLAAPAVLPIGATQPVLQPLSGVPVAVQAPVRLLVLSDLHLEFALFEPPDPALYDIVVLAGDIRQGPRAVQWAGLDSTFGGRPVVLVPGNHEFYGNERTRTLKLLREAAAGSNVHLLDRDKVVIGGVRFLGATLWTDFRIDAGRGTPVAQAMQDARFGLNDFAGQIREHRRDSVRRPSDAPLFTPQDAAREHALSRAWLQERLNAPVRAAVRSTVVVTHHAPSGRSMDPVYEGSRLNPCFYSDLPESFFQTAALWLHGHTHSSSDYRHHTTRIVANPRGYARRNGAIENARFDPALVITVPIDVEPGVRHD